MTYETCNKTDCTGCTVCPSGTAQAVQSDAPPVRAANRTGVPQAGQGMVLGMLPAELDLGDREPHVDWPVRCDPLRQSGMMIWLGIEDWELAWKNGEWKSEEHFNRVQRNWTISGIVINLLVAGLIALGWFVNAFIHWFLESSHSLRLVS